MIPIDSKATVLRGPDRVSRRELLRLVAVAGCGWLAAGRLFGAEVHPPGRLGICSISYRLRWPDVDRGQAPTEHLLDFIAYCHTLGAGGVQTIIPIQLEVARLVRAQIEAKGLYLEGQISLPQSESDLDQFETRVKSAREAGATVLRTACLGGRRYETFQSAQAFIDFGRQAEQALFRAEPVMRKHRMRLAVENHKDWRIPELLGVLKNLSSEFVGVCLDTGNSIALLEDPMAVVEAFAPYTFAMHLKDMAVQDWEKGFLLAEVPLGEGFLNLPEMVALLRRAQPQLRFSLEMITRDPLQVPCLTRGYWPTLEMVPGWALAGALSMVRSKSSKKALPQISSLTPEERLGAEDKAVRQSLEYARKHLDL